MTGKSINMGNSALSSEEVFTVKFSNVNKKDVIINEATYKHEVALNEGDSVDQIDDIISQFPIYYIL